MKYLGGLFGFDKNKNLSVFCHNLAFLSAWLPFASPSSSYLIGRKDKHYFDKYKIFSTFSTLTRSNIKIKCLSCRIWGQNKDAVHHLDVRHPRKTTIWLKIFFFVSMGNKSAGGRHLPGIGSLVPWSRQNLSKQRFCVSDKLPELLPVFGSPVVSHLLP